MTRRSRPVSVLAALYVGFLLVITLAPVPWLTAPNETTFGVLGIRTWIDDRTWTSGSLWEFIANVLIFFPLGVLLRMTLPRSRALVAVALAVAVTTFIEVAQLPLDRVSDPRDLVANSVGALIGVVVASLALAVARADARRVPRGDALRVPRASVQPPRAPVVERREPLVSTGPIGLTGPLD